MKEKGFYYICQNEKCVFRIRTGGKRDLCPFKGCIFATEETAPPYKVLKSQRAEPEDYKNCFFNDKTKCRILKSMDCKNKGECVFFKTAKRLIEEDRENARRMKTLR